LAAVARIAGVDPEQVFRHESSILAPVAFAVAYEAGYALFRSAWLGIAVVLAAVVPIALAPGGGGSYRVLALPATSARQLIAPAALALVFAFVHEPRFALAGAIACAGLVLAFVHATYAVFLLLPLVGFLLARAALERRDLRRIAAAVAALAVPTGGVLLWLLPIARETVSHEPTRQVRCGLEHGIKHYPGQFDVWSCDRFRLAPEMPGRTGSVAGVALQLEWPGDFGYVFGGGGPALVTWIAVVGGAAALVAVALLRRPELDENRGPLVGLAAALFVAPVVWHGLARLDPPARAAQPPPRPVHVLRR